MIGTFTCDGCGKEMPTSEIYILKSGPSLCWNCFYQESAETRLKHPELTPEQRGVLEAHLSELKAKDEIKK